MTKSVFESEPGFVKSDQGRECQAAENAAAADAQLDAATNLSQEQVVTDRVFKTISMFYCALTLGWCAPLLGNTLIHLKYFFNVSTTTLSVALMVQALGNLSGVLMCGLVFDHVNHELAFIVVSLFQGVSYVVAPYIGGLTPFIVTVSVQATSLGFILASGQSYCAQLWKGHRYRDPMLHTWHAIWSLGGVIGPFIVARFLVDLPQLHQSASAAGNWSTSHNSDNYVARSSASTINLTTVSSWFFTSDDTSNFPLDIYASGVANVRYAYVTIGSLAFVTLLLFSIVYLRGQFKTKETSPSSTVSKESTNLRSKPSNAEHLPKPESCSEYTPIGGDSKRNGRYLYLIIFIAQVFVFFHLVCYSTTIPFMYMTAFAITYLNFPVQRASLLMSMFYGFQFVARVIGIPVAAFVPSQTMLIFNVTSTAFFFVILLVFVDVWPTIIWIAAPLAGFTMSTTFAAAMLWISNRVTVTGRLSAIMLVGHSTGGIVGLLVVGQLFESSTPMWFAYVLACSSVSNVLVLFVLFVYDTRYGNRFTNDGNAGLNGEDSAVVSSRKNDGYESISVREDRLALDPNIETNELRSTQPQSTQCGSFN